MAEMPIFVQTKHTTIISKAMKSLLTRSAFVLLIACQASLCAQAQGAHVFQMESLSRGVVALPGKSSGIFVSWRLLGTDDELRTTFDVLCDGKVVARDLYRSTCFTHTAGRAINTYQVVTKVDDEPVDTSEAVKPWAEPVKRLKLKRPTASDCTYSPADCSVGDVDADGNYELFVKWDPSNSKDNSQDGVTGNVFLDCYTLDGTQLWRIDLGPNIRAGAHYTQFMVYDFDGDGRAEMMCKTAPGSKDGTGKYVNQAATMAAIKSASNTAVHRNGSGKITGGQEYLTVFDGQTGAAIHTIYYNPNRDAGYGGAATGTFNWDDRSGHSDYASYGNRGERYLAAVAHLDGPDKPASGIFSRGYYTYAFIWAVNFDGKQLKQKWFHASRSQKQYTVTDANNRTKTCTPPACTSGLGKNTMYGNGNHNISVADVDGDGCDEIVWGSATLDNDGTLLYAVGFGHGDAMHISDMNPDRPGLEVFQVHEEKGTYSWHLHDAATGKVLFKGGNAGKDNGRGIASQLDANHRGFYFTSADDRIQRSAVTGAVAVSASTSMNFRIYWDGDLQDELLDGTNIQKWNGNGTSDMTIKGKTPGAWYSSHSCNSSKSTPNLSADIFGDWREELILWDSSDGATLNIFSTAEPTNYRVPTLMHDHTYRMAICWQNVAYNQPPHLGYYLPDRFVTRYSYAGGSSKEQDVWLGDSIQPIILKYWNCTNLTIDSTFTPTGHVKGLDSCFVNKRETTKHQVVFTGKPEQEGVYQILVHGTGNTTVKTIVRDTLTIRVSKVPDAVIQPSAQRRPTEIYTISGIRVPAGSKATSRHGTYVIREDNRVRKVVR